MKIDDVTRKSAWKARINSIRAYIKRPYNKKERAYDLMMLEMHINMPYRDAVSHYIEDMIRKRLQRYED